MKKLTVFTLCLALLVSSIFVGAYNNSSTGNSEEVDSTTSTLHTSQSDSFEKLTVGAQNLPEASTAPGKVENIIKSSDTLYELTGNATVGSSDSSLLADIQKVLNAGGTFNGNGHTLTTAVNGPMFSALNGGGTIKNLVVTGDISGSSSSEHGVFASSITGSGVTFDTVVVDATITSAKSVGGFVGVIKGTAKFNNCAFTGTLKTLPSISTTRGGGFAVKIEGSGVKATFTSCTSSGKINFAVHIGGFVSELNSGSAEFSDCYSSTELDSVNNVVATEAGSGGFIGALSASDVVVKIEGSLSEASYVIGGEKTRFVGGFVGVLYKSDSDDSNTPDVFEGLHIKDSVSNCSEFEFKGDLAAQCKLGGFLGGMTDASGHRSLKFENCVNKTGLDITSDLPVSVGYGGYIGPIFNNSSYKTDIIFLNCVNSGNVNLNVPKLNLIGGYIAYIANHGGKGTITAENCANNGNFSVSDVTESAVGSNLVAAGFVAFTAQSGKYDVNGFTNNGDISIKTVSSTSGSICAGGMFGINTFNNMTGTLKNCTNNGNITATATSLIVGQLAAGGCGALLEPATNGLTIDGFVNNGDITVNCTSDKTAPSFSIGAAASVIAAVKSSNSVTVKNAINMGNITANHKTAADASGIVDSWKGQYTVSAKNCINLGDVKENGEDGNAIGSNKVIKSGCKEHASADFTASKKMWNGVAVAKLSKAAYDDIKAIADKTGATVEFGAIITLKDYVDKIGEFTHENFDAYYAENKTAIDQKAGKELGRLYEIAKFNSDGQTTLTENELKGDEYVVYVELKNANSEYTYVARTYIKIGNTYIYNN